MAVATLNGMAQREGTNRVKIEVFQIPQNPLWLCWAAEQKHICSHADPTSVQKCTHCLTCTWFVSHLVNLRQRSSRSGTDLHSSGRRCCPAAGWPLCQHPVRKCDATAPRPAACTALRLVYTAQAKQCDCTSKHIVPILTHTGETEHVQPLTHALFSRLRDSEFYRSYRGAGGLGRTEADLQNPVWLIDLQLWVNKLWPWCEVSLQFWRPGRRAVFLIFTSIRTALHTVGL